MRTEKEIRKQIKSLEADDRYRDEPAQVQVNAPLALIQVEMQAKIDALKWVLDS